MNIDNQILINKFGQNILTVNDLLNKFHTASYDEKAILMSELSQLIIQLKPFDSDLDNAVKIGNLKTTFTPVVKLKKGGLRPHSIRELLTLPESEHEKIFILLLSIFKVAYTRRIEVEKDNPSKWWYQDLSNESLIKRIKELSSVKIVIRKLFNKAGIESASILTATLPFSLNLYEKNIIEKHLELHAFNRLYPGKGLTLYREIYDDVASITVMPDIDSLPYEFEEIKVSLY